MARASGGGLFAPWLTKKIGSLGSRTPEIIFSIPFGVYAYMASGLWYVGIIGFMASYFAMEMGHGTFYGMKGWSSKNPDRIQTIEKIVRPLYLKLGGNIRNPLYSWICMGLKGLTIGIPAIPIGPLLAILWPLSYYIGHIRLNSPEAAEWISGAFAGFILAVAFWTL